MPYFEGIRARIAPLTTSKESCSISLLITNILTEKTYTMQTTATLTSKGQVTIPKAIREALALKKNDRLLFTQVSYDVVAIKPVKVETRDLLSLGGSITPRLKPENFSKVRQETLRKVAKAVMRRD